jgi:hypothetical protein
VRKNLYLLVIAILNQLNIYIILTKIILGKNITKTEKKTMWEKTL